MSIFLPYVSFFFCSFLAIIVIFIDQREKQKKDTIINIINITILNITIINMTITIINITIIKEDRRASCKEIY